MTKDIDPKQVFHVDGEPDFSLETAKPKDETMKIIVEAVQTSRTGYCMNPECPSHEKGTSRSPLRNQIVAAMSGMTVVRLGVKMGFFGKEAGTKMIHELAISLIALLVRIVEEGYGIDVLGTDIDA